MSVTVSQKFVDSPRNGCWGDRPYALIDLVGPSSYTRVSQGTYAGGQVLHPADFGLVAGIEGIIVVSFSFNNGGPYWIFPFQVGQVDGLGTPNWTLAWWNTATGNQVTANTDLSNEKIRLLAFGPY